MNGLFLSFCCALTLGFSGCKPSTFSSSQKLWQISTQEEWSSAVAKNDDIDIKGGQVSSLRDTVVIALKLKPFKTAHSLSSIRLTQSPQWNNWQPIAKVTPAEAVDAPVFIPVSDRNYWLLARHKSFDLDGYHAWHSFDMQTWQHQGSVTSLPHRWVTSAEYVDGKFYIYFDYPNDEDPHLIIDEDLTDEKPGFVRVVETTPAQLEFKELSPGYGFQLEFRMGKQHNVSPVLNSFEAYFEEK